jgi:hypothetical protein
MRVTFRYPLWDAYVALTLYPFHLYATAYRGPLGRED